MRNASVLARVPLYNAFRELGYPRLRPLTMSFVVTDRCNSLCKTCHIGARYLADPSIADGELTLDEYRRLLPTIGQLEWVTLSGGEPFMRKDFPDLAVAVGRACRPRVINVPTNATFLSATTRGVAKMLDGLGDTKLILNLSLDGVGAVHDEVRGFDGNFERLLALAEELRRVDDPRLVIGCNTVVSAFNAAEVERTVDFVLDELRPDSYVVEVAQIRPEYHNEGTDLWGDPAAIRASLERALERIARAPRRGVSALVKAFRLHYYRQALGRLDAPRPHRCFSGFATCAVMPKGDVWSNTQRADFMGNLRDFDLRFDRLWGSAAARRARATVRAAACDCETSNVSYPNALLHPPSAMRVAWNALRHR